MKLNNIRLLVKDFDKSFLFYRDTLKFKVTWGNVGENYAEFQASESASIAICCKEIISDIVGTSKLPVESKAQDAAMLVFAMENVDDYYEQLSANGVDFLTPPTDQPDWGIRVAHLRDPEGNLLELVSELKETCCGGHH